MPEASFAVGARGFLIGELQALLGIRNTTGFYGDKTATYVSAVQKRIGVPETGRADATVYAAMGHDFPGEFEICLNLSNSFEGTGFGEVNSTDIDGAGLTWGIAGFTTGSGEVQKLLIDYAQLEPRMIEAFAPQRAQELKQLLIADPSRRAWESFFYRPDGEVYPDAVAAFDKWGSDIKCRKLQLEMTKSRFWVPAVATANKLGLKSMAARGLMLDGYVQNGGWGLNRQVYFRDHQIGSTERGIMATVVSAYANLAAPRWRDDVRKRKQIFLDGFGRVHDNYYNLTTQGFA